MLEEQDIKNQEYTDLSQRLGILEQENASISSNIKNLADAVRSLSDDVRQIKDSSRTNWGTLAAWATVVITILIYHANITIQPLKNILEKHIISEGHSKMLIRAAEDEVKLNELESRLTQTDIILQREMRDLDNSSRNDLKGKDNVLKKEIDLYYKILLQRIEIIEEKINGLKKLK